MHATPMPWRWRLAAVVLAVAATSCSPSLGTILANGADTFGGEASLLAARSLVLDGEVRHFFGEVGSSACIEISPPFRLKSDCTAQHARAPFRWTIDLRSRDWGIEEGAAASGTAPLSYGARIPFPFKWAGPYQPSSDQERLVRQAFWAAHPLPLLREALAGAPVCCWGRFTRELELFSGQDNIEMALLDRLGVPPARGSRPTRDPWDRGLMGEVHAGTWVDIDFQRSGAGPRSVSEVTVFRNPNSPQYEVDRLLDAGFDDYRQVGSDILPFHIRVYLGGAFFPADYSTHWETFSDFVVESQKVLR